MPTASTAAVETRAPRFVDYKGQQQQLADLISTCFPQGSEPSEKAWREGGLFRALAHDLGGFPLVADSRDSFAWVELETWSAAAVDAPPTVAWPLAAHKFRDTFESYQASLRAQLCDMIECVGADLWQSGGVWHTMAKEAGGWPLYAPTDDPKAEPETVIEGVHGWLPVEYTPRARRGNPVRLIELGASEVVMYLGLVGRTVPAVLIGCNEDMVQLLTPEGKQYSSPITLGEAGWNQQYEEVKRPRVDVPALLTELRSVVSGPNALFQLALAYGVTVHVAVENYRIVIPDDQTKIVGDDIAGAMRENDEFQWATQLLQTLGRTRAIDGPTL